MREENGYSVYVENLNRRKLHHEYSTLEQAKQAKLSLELSQEFDCVVIESQLDSSISNEKVEDKS